jgi:DNA-binding NarL/FixJ family response regulator
VADSVYLEVCGAKGATLAIEDPSVAIITVFLADGNKAMLTDLRAELNDEFKIVGTAENGEETVRAVLRLDPDILVLDIAMPVLNGIQVAARLSCIRCRTKVLFLTIHEEPEYISAGVSAGAAGYVSKRRMASDLVRAIREVFAGRTFFSPSLQR